MAQLVGQGEHAVQVVLVVEENIGVDQSAGHIAAGALAHVLVHVDPPVVQGLTDDGLVLLSKRSHRLIDGLLCLLIGNFRFYPGHHGGVHIVHVELLHPQQLFPQTHIAVHLVQVGPNGGNKVVVHLFGHVGAVQGGGQGAGVAARLGEELELLDLGGQSGGQGVFHAPVDGVQVFKGRFPQGSVGAGHQQGIRAIGEGMGLSLTVHRIGESEVGVGELGEDVVGGLGQLPGGGQQLLLRLRQGVGAAALDVVKIAAVEGELGQLGIKRLQPLLGQREQLWHLKGGGPYQLHILGGDLSHHGLIGGHPGVLVAFPLGVVHELAEHLPGLLLQGDKVVEGLGALTQTARVALQRLGEGFQGLELLLPGLITGVEVGGVPGILLRDGIPLGIRFAF